MLAKSRVILLFITSMLTVALVGCKPIKNTEKLCYYYLKDGIYSTDGIEYTHIPWNVTDVWINGLDVLGKNICISTISTNDNDEIISQILKYNETKQAWDILTENAQWGNSLLVYDSYIYYLTIENNETYVCRAKLDGSGYETLDITHSRPLGMFTISNNNLYTFESSEIRPIELSEYNLETGKRRSIPIYTLTEGKSVRMSGEYLYLITGEYNSEEITISRLELEKVFDGITEFELLNTLPEGTTEHAFVNWNIQCLGFHNDLVVFETPSRDLCLRKSDGSVVTCWQLPDDYSSAITAPLYSFSEQTIVVVYYTNNGSDVRIYQE